MTALILAAWCVSVIVVFLPVGRVARFAQRRVRPAPVEAEAPEAALDGPEPAVAGETMDNPPESLPFTTRRQLLGFLGSIANFSVYSSANRSASV